nr:hypothetical protein [Tanacetum cinerariifolium]
MITPRNSRKTWLKHARKKKKSRESPKTPPGSPPHHPPHHPPPPPLPAGPSGASGAPGAFGSSQVPPPPPPPPSSTSQENLEMDEDMTPDEQAQVSNDEDIRSAHILTVNLRQGWWKPFKEERPATPKPAWSIWSSDVPVLTNNWASALASNYSSPLEDSLLAQTDDIAIFMDCVDDPILRHNVSKTLPLGGPPGQVTIQSDFFFNKDLEYLRYGSKDRRPALSILKMKVTYYPDVGLEKMVPDQFWIDKECKYDIATIAVRTHMWILSVVRIKVFSMYGYDYMKKTVLRRADLNEHVITERDFKQLVIRQRVEDFQLGIESYQTQLNLIKPQWDATGFEYKHDYTVIDSPRAVIFWDKYRVQMMMRFNVIHKFSDGMLQQIDEALDYIVKEFRINRMNPEAVEDKADLSQPGELCWWTRQRWKLQTFEAYRMIKSFRHSRPLFDDFLRSLKSKRTIESRAKGSSKRISLGNYPIMLASSHTVKSKIDTKSPTHYPCGTA